MIALRLVITIQVVEWALRMPRLFFILFVILLSARADADLQCTLVIARFAPSNGAPFALKPGDLERLSDADLEALVRAGLEKLKVPLARGGTTESALEEHRVNSLLLEWASRKRGNVGSMPLALSVAALSRV